MDNCYNLLSKDDIDQETIELIRLIEEIEKTVYTSYETILLKSKIKDSLLFINIFPFDISHLIKDSIKLINAYKESFEESKLKLLIESLTCNKILEVFMNAYSSELIDELKDLKHATRINSTKSENHINSGKSVNLIRKTNTSNSVEYELGKELILNPKKYWDRTYNQLLDKAVKMYNSNPYYMDTKEVKFVSYKYPISRMPRNNWGYISYDKKKRTSSKYYFAVLKSKKDNAPTDIDNEVVICKEMFNRLIKLGVRKRNILDMVIKEVFKIN